MKNLIFINGTMGVGKTTVSKHLQDMLPRSAFLDGDWCWDMRPFVVNEETKRMVVGNIAYILGSFLRCSALDNIIFCWVMHTQEIIDQVLQEIAERDFTLHVFTLCCDKEALLDRIQKDVEAGKRSQASVGRSLERQTHYKDMRSKKLDVSSISAKQAAAYIRDKIQRLV